jgi:hypothetical protein
MLSENRDYEYLPGRRTENPACSEADLLWTKPQAFIVTASALEIVNVAKR